MRSKKYLHTGMGNGDDNVCQYFNQFGIEVSFRLIPE